MYDELIRQMMACCKGVPCEDANCGFNPKSDLDCIEQLLTRAVDAIEELSEERDMYIKAMADEHNRAARLAWEHRWIPVTERLPENSGHYLIYVVGGEFKQWSMVTMAYYHKIFYYDDMEDNFDQITHWMPLPEPPKEDIKW